MTVPIPSTYEALAARVTEYAGPEAVEKIMEGYEDPFLSARYVPPSAHRVCQRCGASVADEAIHTGWHRFITLGIRAMSLDMLLRAFAEDEGATP